MRILATSPNLPPASGPFVIGIGMFDGVHLGHQAILGRVSELAHEEQVASLAYTFEPHPLRVLNPLVAPELIEPLATRLERFAELGIDAVLVERFDRAYAATSAERFIEDILVHKLNARHVVVGQGFAFGAGQQGSTAMLVAAGASHAFTAHVVAPVRVSDREVSSTRVRELVRGGDLRGAAELLGRPFSLFGVTVRGAMRGRTLGFPTANLKVDNELAPAFGVYAARASFAAGDYLAAVNIGVSPTFAAEGVKVEAYLVDYAGGDLYGTPMTLSLFERLREERKFGDIEALKAQMALDVASVRNSLGA